MFLISTQTVKRINAAVLPYHTPNGTVQGSMNKLINLSKCSQLCETKTVYILALHPRRTDHRSYSFCNYRTRRLITDVSDTITHGPQDRDSFSLSASLVLVEKGSIDHNGNWDLSFLEATSHHFLHYRAFDGLDCFLSYDVLKPL